MRQPAVALRGHRTLGRASTVDDLAANAWIRASTRGRPWGAAARDAALDLLSTGSTDRLGSTARARLRARLAGMTAADIAHAAGGLGTWARYRGHADGALPRVGPSAVAARSLGLVEGEPWMTYVQVGSLDTFELQHDVTLDADGNLGVLERGGPVDGREARILVDTYLLGSPRESVAAAAELERRAR